MGSPAARIDDGVKHIHGSGDIKEGAEGVYIGGQKAARAGDKVKHNHHKETISEGSATVFINGKPAARMGDKVDCGGKITSGCASVLIG
jgi:uncharacterized Zn-binding protein involved in type VI secretion